MKALLINCTLKKSPEQSHTEGLMKEAIKIFNEEGIETELIRAVDHRIDFGMKTKVSDEDEWPDIFKKVFDANILILGTPIWLGEKSSVCNLIIERLYAHSGETNDKNQYIYYNRVGAAMVTGNEDGGKQCARSILYGLSHIGYLIPPQADAYWVGEAGPGKSYLDGGTDNAFTKKMTRIMSWNLIHLARMLQQQNIPAKGNTVE